MKNKDNTAQKVEQQPLEHQVVVQKPKEVVSRPIPPADEPLTFPVRKSQQALEAAV